MTLQIHSKSTTDAPVHGLAPAQPRILVIDDNQTVTRALSSILEDAGFRVQAHHFGLDALKDARSHPDIAAAVVDVHLPDVSGLVLTRALREQFGPDIPIIVVSGDTSMENLNALRLVGASYFFSKPLKPIQLLARLRQWLD